ncbi:MAG: CYTH domain-containing protein [Lachnospiraceae bacterium]|nr:CYTH domain-containing protein [Lachnospiraceae bacterium]
MEIERKFLISKLPENLEQYHFLRIEQAYLCTNPVIRIRREDENYYLTYKGSGLMAREESNLPLTAEGYNHLLLKADGNVISKRRYLIPLVNPKVVEGSPQPPDGYTLLIELDIFSDPFAPLVMAEVEFGSKEAAESFLPPDWFGEEVTYDTRYHNSTMSMMDLIKSDPET